MKKVTICLADDLDVALDRQCRVTGLSRTAMTERALRRYLLWLQVAQRRETFATKSNEAECGDAPD